MKSQRVRGVKDQPSKDSTRRKRNRSGEAVWVRGGKCAKPKVPKGEGGRPSQEKSHKGRATRDLEWHEKNFSEKKSS